jgi:TPR repeat protein
MLSGRGRDRSTISPRSLVAAIPAVACALLVGAGLISISPAPALSATHPSKVPHAASLRPVGLQPVSPQSTEPMDPLLVEVIGFYTGSGGHMDDARAHELLLEAAADNDTLSRMWLARVYSRGRMLFERDDERAREIAADVIDEVRRLADGNHHEAAFLMGTAYAEGLGVEENQELAMAWYYRAADLGNMLAQHNLGNAYHEGNNAPQDFGIAAYWFHRAAEQGDALPMFWLGQFYENGDGVEQDREKALYWYRESAKRGRADAQAALDRLGG